MATVSEVNHRQATIVALTNEHGRCNVTELSESFGVTPETIRRDLKALEGQGLLRRVHGGAVSGSPTSHSELLAVDEVDELPIHQSQRRKQVIGHAALSLIPGPNASMLIDAGSTTEAFANVLARNYLGQNWSVVTNSPNVAKTLSAAGVPQVGIIGGTVKARTQAVVGSRALAQLSKLRADIAFLGTSGLSITRGFTTSDPREAQIKQSMIQHARRAVALCDSAKVGKESAVSFARLEDVDTVVTDRNIPESAIEAFAPLRTELLIP